MGWRVAGWVLIVAVCIDRTEANCAETLSKIQAWSEFSDALKKLSGEFSIHIQTDKINDGFRSSAIHPTGSGFKLYVLGALATAIRHGDFTWNSELAFNKESSSLPPGGMHGWGVNNRGALSDYATEMIRVSDNTATDHLIRLLGRERVETILGPMKNSAVQMNKPFLTTAEFFKLKWAAEPELQKKFLTATEERRREILEQIIKEVSFAAVGANGTSFSRPTLVSEIEWFASTEDLTRAILWLKDFNDPEIFKILSQNTGGIRVGDGQPWKYVGFKGGSEPGVITLTFLMQRQNGQWGAVAFAWKSESAVAPSDLVEKAVRACGAILYQAFRLNE